MEHRRNSKICSNFKFLSKKNLKKNQKEGTKTSQDVNESQLSTPMKNVGAYDA